MLEEKQGQFWNPHRIPNKTSYPDFRYFLLFCCFFQVLFGLKISSVGRGDSSHFPHIYNSLKTGRAGIVCSSVMVVPHMTFMHSEYP